jgi:hypothetical protein
MGKDKGRVASVRLQVELNVATRPRRVGNLPPYATGWVKLFDRYLCDKTLAVKSKLSDGTNLRLDCRVARPPLAIPSAVVIAS